jgi:hypothetical protein
VRAVDWEEYHVVTEHVVVTDCRFTNEVIWGIKRAGWIVRVERPGAALREAGGT